MTALSAALLALALLGAFRLPRPESRAASLAWALAVAAAGLGFTRALRPHLHPESQLWLLWAIPAAAVLARRLPPSTATPFQGDLP